MRIALVLTYPIYHSSSLSVEEWFNQPDRERQLAAAMAQMGHRVELWAVGEFEKKKVNNKIEIDEKGFKTIIFPPNKKNKKSKRHFSEALNAHAREFMADIHILKGVDGGIGIHLLRDYLIPNQRAFAFIIGGEYYSPFNWKAEIILYETEVQRQMLVSPGWRLWRKRIPESNLVRFPKLIDTDLFSPFHRVEKKWDLLIVGRMIPRYKNYDALGALSQQFRVAVIGDGPQAHELMARYPGVEWLGYVPNSELPRYYNRTHLFMHTGFRDFYPRVIAEALACGIPCIAFSKRIAGDVLPPDCGLLLSHNNFIIPIRNLLKNRERLARMSQQARQYSLKNVGEAACRKSLQTMFARLQNRSQFQGTS